MHYMLKKSISKQTQPEQSKKQRLTRLFHSSSTTKPVEGAVHPVKPFLTSLSAFISPLKLCFTENGTSSSTRTSFRASNYREVSLRCEATIKWNRLLFSRAPRDSKGLEILTYTATSAAEKKHLLSMVFVFMEVITRWQEIVLKLRFLRRSNRLIRSHRNQEKTPRGLLGLNWD